MRRNRFFPMLLIFLLGAAGVMAQETPVEHEHKRDGHNFTFAWHAAGGGFLGVRVVAMTPELRTHFWRAGRRRHSRLQGRRGRAGGSRGHQRG